MYIKYISELTITTQIAHIYASKQVLPCSQVAFLAHLTMSFGCISPLGVYAEQLPSPNGFLLASLYKKLLLLIEIS